MCPDPAFLGSKVALYTLSTKRNSSARGCLILFILVGEWTSARAEADASQPCSQLKAASTNKDRSGVRL